MEAKKIKIRRIFLVLFFIAMSVNSFAQNYRVSEFKIEGIKRIKKDFVEKITSVEPGGVLDSIQIEADIKLL